MGGLPCYKDIIDQRNALVQVLDCMAASLTAGLVAGIQPTYEEQERFRAAAKAMADCASAIGNRVAADAGILAPSKAKHGAPAT